MARREHITLVGGRSKREVERRLFGGNLRVTLDADTDKVTRRLIRGYSRAWKSMHSTAQEMANVAAEAKHSGLGLSERDIARIDRVDRAQFALNRQIRELSKFTGVEVKGAASSGIGRVVSDVIDTLPGLAGVDRRFTKPSGAAIEGLILRSTGRIESATRALDARGQMALKDALFRGLVLGENPRETAKQILATTETAFFGGLSRANTIARTEIADAHRYATRLAYNADEFVVGWKWLATLSTRTCPACWSMHNTFHEKSEVQFAHQNCRCTQVPVMLDDIEADHDLGDPEQIFWGLPREDQLAIMGPGRLKALEGGARFSDLSFLQHNPSWRPSYQVTSVADLAGLAELNIATTPGDVIEIPGLTNESILSYAFAQGGLTINAATGEQPTHGFVVARKGTSLVVDAREFFGPAGPNAVAAWLTAHGDRLDAPGAHMGMWYDTHNGKVVLDVVEILDDRDAAIALGRAEDQIAIFDLDTFTEISTGGSGGYADPPPLSSALVGLGLKGTGTGTGTPDDPINVKGNVLLAAKLIGEGKHVRLNKISEVGTLLDALTRMVAEAKAKGEDAPDFDLCRVSVGGTNLFCAETKGIPRIKMPQLGGVPLPGSKADALPRTRGEEVDILPEFRAALEGMGIAVTDKTVPANYLKATQNQLIGPKVAGISKAMETAPPDSGLFAPIFVTRDGYVLDGHHRWAANVAWDARDGDLDDVQMHVMEIDMEIGEALAAANAFAAEWGIPQQGFTGAGFTGKSAVRPAGADVGAVATILVDGVEKMGKVVRTPDYSDVTIIELPDGTRVNAWPDQIKSVYSPRLGAEQKEAERIKALQDLAVQVEKDTGIEDVNFAGMTLDDAKETAEAIKKVMHDYPGIKPTALKTGAADGAYAVTNTSFVPVVKGQDASLTSTKLKAVSEITVADEFSQDPKRWESTMTAAVNRGHFHKGSDDEPQEYVADHEFGHVVDFDLWGHPGFNPDPRFEIVADVHNALYADDIKAGRREKFTLQKIKDAGGVGDPGFFKAVEKDLSAYATQSVHEMFAEAFAVYRDHGPGNSIVADTIMRNYVRAYRKKYGHWPEERDLGLLLGAEYQPST